jgi:hypothetical protein
MGIGFDGVWRVRVGTARIDSSVARQERLEPTLNFAICSARVDYDIDG